MADPDTPNCFPPYEDNYTGMKIVCFLSLKNKQFIYYECM